MVALHPTWVVCLTLIKSLKNTQNLFREIARLDTKHKSRLLSAFPFTTMYSAVVQAVHTIKDNIGLNSL